MRFCLGYCEVTGMRGNIMDTNSLRNTAIFLTILFVALKLTGHIAWSWVWVLAPILIPWVFVFGIIAITFGTVLFTVMIATIAAVFIKK